MFTRLTRVNVVQSVAPTIVSGNVHFTDANHRRISVLSRNYDHAYWEPIPRGGRYKGRTMGKIISIPRLQKKKTSDESQMV